MGQMPVAQARRELARRGLVFDEKTVWRIANGLGAQLLATRTRDVLAWREGCVPPGNELRGKRVAVEIDGGRVRTRRPVWSRGRPGKRRKFRTDWREPKLLIIFELDEQGRMQRKSQPWIDGTLEGPEALMELLVYHLHRLGGASAESVTFLGDGAPWIWDRLSWVCRRVGLQSHQVECVLDWCHGTHHVSLALAQFDLPEDERRRVYRKLRGQLKQGQHGEVVSDLRRRAEGCAPDSEVWTEIAYLEKHADHMRYATFRRRGLPIGSGAIESAVRQVINLRLKGSGIFWREENAEGMLVLRAAVVSDRWDEAHRHVRDAVARDRRKEWHWKPPDTLAQMKSPLEVRPPSPQSQSTAVPRRTAA